MSQSNLSNTWDRAGATLALSALALWVGGIVALGACAAPVVFSKVELPLAGDTMGTIFRRFDKIAMGSAMVLLLAEAIRAWFRPARATLMGGARGLLSLAAAGCAVYVGLVSSPRIWELHQSGVVRGQGALGAELERVHHLAEILGKTSVLLGLALIVLHVVTLRPALPAPAPQAD